MRFGELAFNGGADGFQWLMGLAASGKRSALLRGTANVTSGGI